MSDTAIAEVAKPAKVDPRRKTNTYQPNFFRTIDQRASELGVHGNTLRNLIREGKGPKVRKIGAKRLGISDSDWQEWLDKREVQPGKVGK